MKFALNRKACELAADALEFMEPTGDTPDPAKELAKIMRQALALDESAIPGIEFEYEAKDGEPLDDSGSTYPACDECDEQHSQDVSCDDHYRARAIHGQCVSDEELAAERAALSPADRAIVDALPSPADAASHAQVSAVLKEFMADVEAIGYAQTCKQWPDLSITYKKAKALNLNA